MKWLSSGGLAALDSAFDRAIGADRLKPDLRDRLLIEQMRSVLEMAPAVMAGSSVVLAVLLFASLGTPQFPAVALMGAILFAVHVRVVHLWWLRRSDPGPSLAIRARRMSLYSLTLGMLWGAMLMVLPADNPQQMLIAVAAIGTQACGIVVGLLNFPRGGVAFSVPILVAAILVNVRHADPAALLVHLLLLLSFAGVLSTILLRHARAFVAHRASESLVSEKHAIIGLLLKEFEASTSDWLWGFDSEGRIDRISAGFLIATKVEESELMGADFVQFLHCVTPPDDPLMAKLDRDFAEQRTFTDVEIRVIAGGNECWWSLTGKPFYDQQGQYSGYIGMGADISARKIAERRITTLAHYDPLTGLLNRTKFTEHLNGCAARLERYGSPFSVMFLDLDKFKAINDECGHPVGDKVLVQTSRRILNMVRETDLVARLGGDEFAIILTNDCSPSDIAGLAQRLIDCIGTPLDIEGQMLLVGLSVGIAMAPVNGTHPDQILRNADLALYRAKADGRDTYRFFESQMDKDARQRRALEAELREAVRRGELALHYQPLVDALDKQPTGFEALIRWNHPTRGLVLPTDFIPAAEQSALILEIGNWTIQQACLAAANWPEHLTVSVNLSAKHFRTSGLEQVIERALATSGLAPHRLEIEITEGMLLENPDQVMEKLGLIRKLGVTVAMDDFGTGYSSLSYLLKFPFDRIKIDKSFVDASGEDTVARDILRSIATLGKALKVRITAEGVETREQAEFLSEIACHQLQGFYFAKPLDSVDLPHYLLSQVAPRHLELKAEAEASLRPAQRA